MSIRNVIRRPSTTALVLGGLMVGTAIVSASLVVGDTLDNMIVGETAKSYGAVDFVVSGTGIGNSTLGYYNYENVSAVQDQVRNLDHVTSAEWYVSGYSSIKDINSNLSTPSIGIIGMTDGFVKGFGGFVRSSDGSSIDTLPATGHAYMNKKLADVLNTHDGDSIVLYYNGTPLMMTAEVVNTEKLGAYQGIEQVYVDMPVAQQLFQRPGTVDSMAVAIDSQGRDQVNTTRDSLNATISASSDLNLKIRMDRAAAIQDGKDGAATFTSMFFVFGSFSIIAGVALIINIFTMLGEERKGEMGVARAIGMQKNHLRKLFTYEGLIYATIAAAIGTLVGLVLAYGLIIAASMLISMGGVAIDQYFGFQPFSLVAAYLVGFLITLVTIYFVTRRISNMNIVRAVRNIPEPGKTREDRGLFRLGFALLGFGAVLMLLGISSESRGLALSGLSLITLSTGLLLRKYVGDRIAWNIAGFVTLFVWVPKGFEIFPYTGNIEMFVLAGIFMVSALLIIVMFNSDSIVYLFTKVLRVKGGYKAVIKTAISYPLRSKMRTALSIFIFGLVIFTVTTLSMMSGMLAVGIPKMIDDTSGGFDVVAYSATPFDMWDKINTTSDLVHKENITTMVQLSSGQSRVILNKTDQTTGLTSEEKFRYDTIGIDTALYTVGNYPLTEWNKTTYASETEVWQAAQSNSSLVILDGSAASSSGGMNMGPVSAGFAGTAVGTSFIITDAHSQNHTVTVIGIMKQVYFSGIFIKNDYVRNDLDVNGTNLFAMKLASGLDADQQCVLLENQFLQYGVGTIALKSLAKQVVSQIDGMFNLIKAFLAMGLIIGITGLGIITIRSIHERRIEIGMMRAIGYTKRMVVVNFALESAFVSVLGILIGSALGIVVGYQLWDTGFKSMGIGFLIDWWPIIVVGIGAFLATLLSVIPAARGASRVSPAEVLRFE